MTKDILISATPETVAHKLEGEIPDQHDYCFWEVTGTPRQTEPGRSILFADAGRVHARGAILELVDGEIRFLPLERADEDPPADPPPRGFKYVESTANRS